MTNVAQRTSLKDRLLAASVVDAETGCRLWIRSTSRTGYGKFSYRGKRTPPHRLAYEAWVGLIPEGMFIDHLCRVRHCIEPSHLEPVTNHENLMRGNTPAARNVAKTHCPQDHEYTLQNTAVRGGKRHCRACDAERARRNRRLLHETRAASPYREDPR